MFRVERDKLVYEGPGPENVDEAWDISIEKWKTLVDDPVYVVYDEGGYTTCGLCMLYNTVTSDSDWDCGRCPIALDGHPGCSGTPYNDYAQDPCYEYAQDELEYLLALRARQ